jgi:hypothetical protein
MGITAQIFEDGFRGGEGPFGVDVPFLGAELGVKLTPAVRSGTDFGLSVELNLAAEAGFIEQVEKLGPENQTECLDVKQEIGFGRNPSRTIIGECATGDQTMEMEVVAQSLVPGVKDGEETDLAVQVSPAEIGQGLRNGLEEDVEEDLLVDEHKGIELVRKGENQMEIRGGYKVGLLSIEPIVGGACAALGAVAVAAGVVARALEAAMITPLQMTAEH